MSRVARPMAVGRVLAAGSCAALLLCGTAYGQCGIGNGDCFSANGTPGCDNEACCGAVCDVVPGCCDVAWDEACADAAGEICGSCQPGCGTINVACLGPGPEFNNRLSVGRVTSLSGGTCTGFIVAAPNLVLTSRRCITTDGEPGGPVGEVTLMIAEFGFECDACLNGFFFFSIIFNVVELIHDDVELDYAILKTDGDPSSLFGVLSMDETPPAVGEAVYGIHHAEGDVMGFEAGTVTTATGPALCSPSTSLEFGVSAVGDDRSAGAPIFRQSSHCVVGVSHCGDACSPAFAVPVAAILPDALPFILEAGGALDDCTGGGSPCPGEGSCFEPGSTPGCDLEDCCNVVCAVDPFCCIVEWDEFCAIAALQSCSDPDCPGEGGCFEANGSPGCDDPICCNTICQLDAFCCNVQWDAGCAEQASRSCPPPPGECPGEGSCFEATPTPGCDVPGCCAAVCQLDPLCCEVEWDVACVVEAGQVCGLDCGHPDAGNCLLANGTPFCNNLGCCDAVCGADPLCCDVGWDTLCAEEAQELCSVAECPGPGDCFVFNGTPGCNDPLCCATVCLMDVFCCEVLWDQICADEALELCLTSTCPWDLDGDGKVGVLDLLALLAAWGSCGGCPEDFNGDGVVGVLDLLDLLANFGPCPGSPCPWDVNGDGVVDHADLRDVTRHQGPCDDPDDCPWDVDGSGEVNGLDIQAVARHFGACP